MKVDHILQSKGTDVFSVASDDSLSDAVSVLNDKNIGAVLVTDASQNVVGILSERDVVRQMGSHGAEAMHKRVSECMTADPVSCSCEATIDQLMGEMTKRRIRHIPVIEGGALKGLVSIGDVVKRKIEQAEQEAEALKEYIAS